jgi:CTP synthase
VFSAPDVPSVYEIPFVLEQQGVGNKVLKSLHITTRKTDFTEWNKVLNNVKNAKKQIKIAVVGKYFGTGNYTLSDSYISVIEAIKHASFSQGAVPILEWIDSEQYEKKPARVRELANYDGIIVPGGFGTRGVEGIIKVITFARENKKPYLGLCYGMQLACIEFARNVLGKKNANTVEVNPATSDPIIHINPRQADNVKKNRYGGTMRLGAYDADLFSGSKVQKAYGVDKISERHRHRYEFNNDYREAMEKAGLKVVGVNPQANLVEIVELENHPFFVGTQFHPEFKSRPMRAHPLFREFIKTILSGTK